MARNTSTRSNSKNSFTVEFISTYLKEQVIIPMRFVWHVLPTKNRSSIQTKGITKSNASLAIFANNIRPSYRTIELMCPLPIHAYDYPNLHMRSFLDLYDFWRIDSQSYDAEWRTNPFLRNDLNAFDLRSPHDYICSLNNVPVYALELYRCRGEKAPLLYNTTGVSSVMILSILKAA